MTRLTIVGETAPHLSYAQIAYEVIRGCHRREIFPAYRYLRRDPTVSSEFAQYFVHTVQPERGELLFAVPSQVPTPGKATLAYTMWESSRLPDQSVRNLNRATVVVVPCQWCRQSFIESGVKTPIEVVPLGIDPSLFYPLSMSMHGPCVIGTAGNLHNGAKRKGVMDVVESFGRVFRGVKDVRLKVKVIGDASGLPQDDRIDVTTEILTPKALARWYSTLTAYASFARAEGYGLHQLQSLACGRPVIAAPYSGMADFLAPDLAYICNYTEVPAEELWTGHGQWCEPDPDHFDSLMEQVYKDRQLAREKGLNGAAMAKQLTWEKMSAATIDTALKWIN